MRSSWPTVSVAWVDHKDHKWPTISPVWPLRPTKPVNTDKISKKSYFWYYFSSTIFAISIILVIIFTNRKHEEKSTLNELILRDEDI